MFSRRTLTALMVLLSLSSVEAQHWVPDPFRILVFEDHLSEEITRMDVFEVGLDGVPSYIAVDLQGHVGTLGTLAGMNIQVWLLRTDGSTVAQRQTLPCMDCFIGIPPMDSRRFTFAPASAKELAGVVVKVSGRLYVREIKVS